MTRKVGLSLLTVVALLLCATPANAAHVACGDTITATTVLDSDVVCAGRQDTGLRIGAGNLTLWLNGYTVRGPGAGTGIHEEPSGTGILSDTGDLAPTFSGVDIRGGGIEGFAHGISVKVSDSFVRNVSVTTSKSGILLAGDRNQVYRSRVGLTGDQTEGDGITVAGADAYLWNNLVFGDAQFALQTQGENPRVILNTVENCLRSTGIFVVNYTTTALVAQNRLRGCNIGITAWGSGARVQRNEASRGCVGMVVRDSAARVRYNTTNQNCGAGIDSDDAGTTLTGNVANRNESYGIYAAAGTVDGGGNTAVGNGTGNCVNVSCP